MVFVDMKAGFPEPNIFRNNGRIDASDGVRTRPTIRATAGPIRRIDTSVGMAGGESSRTPRRAPALRRSSLVLSWRLL